MEGHQVVGEGTLAKALVIDECPELPQIIHRITPSGLKVESWVYSCGLLVDITFGRMTQPVVVVPVVEAHRLHHLEHHEPFLDYYTLNLLEVQGSYRSWCAECLHVKPIK